MTDFQRQLLALARHALTEYFQGRKPGVPEALAALPEAKKTQGAFVTLRKNHQLRGCIGNLAPQAPLIQLIPALALESAFEDPRFPPVEEYELPSLRLEISLLTPAKPLKVLEDLVLGQDGIILQKGIHRALFLPGVATEQGWDLETTLRQLCRKAGLPQEAWKESTCRWETFQSVVFAEP